MFTLKIRTWAVISAVAATAVACHRQLDPIGEAIQHTRPELRKAFTAMRTPTTLLDNYGDELQVAYRLQVVLEYQHFRPKPGDEAYFQQLLTNTTESPYSRICAAFFLLDSDQTARAMLTNYVGSKNLRHRFNAARAIQWYAWGARGEARDWAGLQLVKMIETKCLELPSGTVTISPGYEPNGHDMMDDSCSPLGYVIDTIGDMKERRAIPALEAMIQRGDSGAAASALGKIGDVSVAPFLMGFCTPDRPGAISIATALGQLKYLPAVPLLTNHLQQSKSEYESLTIVRALVDIGDPSAIPAIEAFVQSSAGNWQSSGAVLLAQLREKDPVQALLTMQSSETNKDTQVEILRGLGRFPDLRAIDRLSSVAVSSGSSLLRHNAIWALGSMHDQRAMLALVSLLETNAPPPTDFDKLAILDGRPPDYSRRQAERALREASRRHFGMDADAWRSLITQRAD